ncbi:MAG: hypothetical protein ACI8UO_002990 [Verrucomicrobiales bacterium]|jgi:hypothetical protein
MSHPHFANLPALPRRHFLKGVGTAIALPFLDAMVPAFARGASGDPPPRRFVGICTTLGLHAPHLFPKTTGRDYEMTTYLKHLKEHREDFTLFSGLSHQNQQGNDGHASEMTWLTGAMRPGLAGFRNTISLDQLIAEKIGLETRFPYLALSSGGGSMSWSASGVSIPAENSPAAIFKALFTEGADWEKKHEMSQIKTRRSILDTVMGEAKKLENDLGERDREKLDEYLTSVRDLELRLQQSEGWVTRPKPKTDAKPPTDIEDKNDTIARQLLIYDMMALAIQSDSTRTMTFQIAALGSVPSNLPGVHSDWHGLSHHGRDETKIKELRIVEEAQFTAFNGFLAKLKSIRENDSNLLDNTSIIFGSNLGNASAHDWRNLPIILAGGGFKHGSYVAHDAKDNTPLSNLFVPVAQRMGVEIERFATSTQPHLEGLES